MDLSRDRSLQAGEMRHTVSVPTTRGLKLLKLEDLIADERGRVRGKYSWAARVNLVLK